MQDDGSSFVSASVSAYGGVFHNRSKHKGLFISMGYTETCVVFVYIYELVRSERQFFHSSDFS